MPKKQPQPVYQPQTTVNLPNKMDTEKIKEQTKQA